MEFDEDEEKIFQDNQVLETPENYETFENIESWLEWYQQGKYNFVWQMLLKGLFVNKAFEDPSGLTGYSAPKVRLRNLLDALGSTQPSSVTLELALFLILSEVVKKGRMYPWSRSIPKTLIFELMQFISQKYHRSIGSSRVKNWMKDFLKRVLETFPPKLNTEEENILIIETVIDCDEIDLLKNESRWLGSQEVIQVLVRLYYKPGSRLRYPNDTTLGLAELATHLIASRRLDKAIDDLLLEFQQ